jgi:hypothetical protein
VARADFDSDGDPDLVVSNTNGQLNAFYRNIPDGFRLRTEGTNTHAWGAKVRAKALIRGEPRWMTRWNVPTTGYASQNQLLVRFGLDDAEQVDSLVVRWPSGREELHTNLEARRYGSLLEGAADDPKEKGRR